VRRDEESLLIEILKYCAIPGNLPSVLDLLYTRYFLSKIAKWEEVHDSFNSPGRFEKAIEKSPSNIMSYNVRLDDGMGRFSHVRYLSFTCI
jgi:hypothetical protein